MKKKASSKTIAITDGIKDGIKNGVKTPHVNKVLKFLILSDLIMLSGFGLSGPVFAVFVADKIDGGSLAVAGIASAIFLGVKSLLALPVARSIDKRRGEEDDYKAMLFGSLLAGTVPFLYLVAQVPWQIYLAQVIYGIGCALNFPSWAALFTRHTKGSEVAQEWSLYYTLIDLGAAIAAFVGGILSAAIGFRWLFFIVGIMTTIGAMILVPLAKYVKNSTTRN